MTIVLCTWGSFIEGGTEEALTVARKLGASLGAELHWLVLGGAASEAPGLAATHGVASLDVISDPALAGFQPDALVEALVQYCGQVKPTTILFNQTVAARLIAPRVAGRLGAAGPQFGFRPQQDVLVAHYLVRLVLLVAGPQQAHFLLVGHQRHGPDLRL